MRRRPGYVLVTVILVGALLFVSAAMLVSQLTTEAHVTKTDAYFKSALNLAETGLNKTLVSMEFGTSAERSQWAQWFQLYGGHVGTAVVGTDVHGTYQVTATVVGTPVPLGGGMYRGEVQLTSVGAVYPPSVTSMVGSTAYAARRAIRSITVATWSFVPGSTTTTTETTTFVPDTLSIRYGIFTGADLVIKGASSEIRGDVFANGNVFVQKASGLQASGTPPEGGQAYAVGTVTGGIPASTQHASQAAIPFPVIDTALMRTMYDAYVTGKYPYDGTNASFMDTRATVDGLPNPAGVANRTLYHIDDLLNASTTWTDPLDALHQLKVLPAGHINATVAAAMTNPKGFYFFAGAVDLPKDTAAAWSGTVVIDGDFDIHSNITVGTPGNLMNLMVTGNITKDNGCSAINGVVYTNGTFSGNGTAALTGALLTRGSVDINGTLDITYVPGLPAAVTGGHLVQTKTTTTTTIPPTYALESVVLPVAGQRMWQEVTVLN